MANAINIEAALLDSTDETISVSPRIVVRRSGAATHIYIFFISSAGDLSYRKSTNGGTSFATAQTIDTGEDWATVAVWYDRWTPGDTTGNLIHIAATSTTNDKLVYFSLDASSDTAGTNNDVDIDTWTDISPAPDGCVSICKGANGHLYAGCIGGTGPVGLQVGRSQDSGATWSDISSPASGTDIQAEYNDDLDVIRLHPLKTDNDIILVAIDASAAQLESTVFDAVGGTWGTVTTVEAGPDAVSFVNEMFGMALDKSTGDQFMVYKDGQFNSHTTGANYFFTKFSDATRTWSVNVTITDNDTTNGAIMFDARGGFSLCRDETNGILLMVYGASNDGDNLMYNMRLSSDDGQTWGDKVLVNGRFADDYRGVSIPPVMNDTAEGWYFIWYNDDGDDIEGLNGALEYKTFSGVTYDNDGTTPVSGVDVHVFRSGYYPRANMQGSSDIFQGRAVSDGSGNYKIGVLGNLNDDTESETYYATGYKQGATDADDEAGTSREDSSD